MMNQMYLKIEALPPPTCRLVNLPNGKAGVSKTLDIMRDLIRKGKIKLPIRLTALDIIAQQRQKDFYGEISALFYFVRDYIRYVRDIRDVETLQQPERTLQFRAGDCDDKVILLASLLESVGHETRLKAVGFRPKNFAHVYLQTKVGHKWVSLETTEPRKLGWEPKNAVETMTRKV